MFCGKCGAKLDDGQRFCMKCGAKVDGAAAKAADDEADKTVQLVATDAPQADAPQAGLSTDDGLPAGGTAVGLSVDDGLPEGGLAVGLSTDDELPEADEPAGAGEGAADAGPEPSANVPETGGIDVLVSDETLTGASPVPAAAPTVPMPAARPVAQQVVRHAPAMQPQMPVGQPVYGAGAAYGAPAAQQGGGTGAKVAAVAVSVIAVVAVVAVVLVMLGIGPFGSVEQAQGDEPIACSRVTRIFPEDDEGNPLGDCTVTVIDRLTGETVAVYDVTDESGFTFGDITKPDGTPLDSGRYDISITDNTTGNTVRYPSVDYDPENDEAEDEVEVKPDPAPSTEPAADPATEPEPEPDPSSEPGSSPAQTPAPVDSSAQKKAMYGSYLDVLNDSIAQYGEGATSTFGGSGSSAATQLNGVCFAKLVDLDGDKAEELVVLYYDKAAANRDQSAREQNDARYYTYEVWAYTGGKAERVHSGLATPYGNGGFVEFDLYRSGGETYFVDESTAMASWEYVVTVQDFHYESGDMKPGKEYMQVVSRRDPSDVECTIDGEEVSQDAYGNALKGIRADALAESHLLSAPSGSAPGSNAKVQQTAPADTLATVSTVKAQLENGAKTGDASGAAASADTVDDKFLAKIGEYEKKYGQAKAVSNGSYCYLTGVVWAYVGEFGKDKPESLVVCYYDPAKDSGSSDEKGLYGEGYVVEVWTPTSSAADAGIERAYSTTAFYDYGTDDSVSYVGIKKPDSNVAYSRIIAYTPEGSGMRFHLDSYLNDGGFKPNSDNATASEFAEIVRESNGGYTIMPLVFQSEADAGKASVLTVLSDTKASLK